MEHFDNESILKSYLLLCKTKNKTKERLCELASKSTYYIFISNNTSTCSCKRFTQSNEEDSPKKIY